MKADLSRDIVDAFGERFQASAQVLKVGLWSVFGLRPDLSTSCKLPTCQYIRNPRLRLGFRPRDQPDFSFPGRSLPFSTIVSTALIFLIMQLTLDPTPRCH